MDAPANVPQESSARLGMPRTNRWCAIGALLVAIAAGVTGLVVTLVVLLRGRSDATSSPYYLEGMDVDFQSKSGHNASTAVLDENPAVMNSTWNATYSVNATATPTANHTANHTASQAANHTANHTAMSHTTNTTTIAPRPSTAPTTTTTPTLAPTPAPIPAPIPAPVVGTFRVYFTHAGIP